MQAVQGMLVHPGWHDIIPCSKTLSEIYLAMEFGDLDLQIDMSSFEHGEKKQLRDLMTIPAYQQAPVCAEWGQRVVANMQSMEMPGDASHQAALKCLGRSNPHLPSPLLCPFSITCPPSLSLPTQN